MSNRPRLRKSRRQGPLTGIEPLALARLFRQECDACGSHLLRWEVGHELRSRDPRLLAAIAPPWLTRAEVSEAFVWHCLSCSGAGLFAGMEVG